MIPKKRDTFIGEILVSAGLLDEPGLARGLERQKETGELLGEALVSLALVSVEDIEWALSSQYQLPLVRPRDITVDPDCRSVIPETLAREFNVAPLFRTGNELSVVIDDPLELERLASVPALQNLELNIALATPEDVSNLIDELYGELATDPTDPRPPVESSRMSSEELLPHLQDYSGASLGELVFRRAIAVHATSIAFEPGTTFGEIRLRTGTVVHESFRVRADWGRTLVKWLRVAAKVGENIEGSLRGGSGRLTLEDREVAFSVTFVRKEDGEAAMVKLPVGAPVLPNLGELELPEGATERIATLLARRQGLWIVSGSPPASTSRILHALLQAMVGPSRRFLSLREDSRGYEKLEAFRSMQVIHGAGGGRVAVPTEGEWDGLVLPPIFEKNEIERALRYALTGRTVVATMDFPDPRSVLRFLLCQGTNIALMTSAMAGVLAQKEIRVLCAECKQRIEGHSTGASTNRVLGEGAAHYRPVGCERCRFTGFSSRETILDFWAMDAELKRVLHGSSRASGRRGRDGARGQLPRSPPPWGCRPRGRPLRL